jgi:iron complex transport system substrate-binding protein
VKMRLLSIMLLIAFFLSSALFVSAQDADLTLVDGAGNTLTFDKAPQRIVCLYSRCIELLAALEVEPVGAMVSDEPLFTDAHYFPQPNKITVIEWEGDSPNLEQIAAIKPDLVLGWEELREPLKGIAPVYSVIDSQDSYEKSHVEIRAFAKLLGREQVAEQNIKAAVDRLAAYKAKSPANLSVMYGFFYNSAFNYRDGASGTCNLLKEVAKCDWADPKNVASWSVQVSDEGLLALNPDVLLLDGFGFDGKTNAEIVKTVSERPLWPELSAVKANRVFIASDAVANMDGMGTVGMTLLLDVYMPLLYPDVFPVALTNEQVAEIVAGATGAATAVPTENASAGANDVTVTDPTGKTFTFDAVPKNIICLYHECIELMSALGIEPLAILAPNWLPDFASDPVYFPQPNKIVKLVPQDSGSWNYEVIAALKPDIIFGSAEDRTALDGIAKVYDVGPNYSMNHQDTLDHLMEFAKMLNRTNEATAVVKRYQDRHAAYKALAPRNQSVLIVAYWDKGAWLYSGASVPCSILNKVAKCDWANPDPQPGSWGYSSSVEAVLKLDPDTIILENWTELPNDKAMEQLRADPLWSALRAVQKNRIFPMTNRDGYGLGPIGGIKLLDLYLPLIYPDVFPKALTDEQVAEILKK